MVLRTTGTSLLLFVLALLLARCSGLAPAIDENTGRTVVYTPGVPNFDLEAISTLRDEQSGFDLYVGIPRASLIFLNRGEEYVGRYEGLLQLLDSKGKGVVFEETWSDTVVVEDYLATQRYENILVERRFDVEPGEYIVHCSVQDLNSKQSAMRSQRLVVFERMGEQPALSRIRVEGRVGEDPFEPIVALHVSENVDSMRAVVELYDAPDETQIDISMVLLKFRSDTTVATQPYWISPMMGSISYRGVDYRRPDTIQVSQRTLSNLSNEVAIEFTLPDLDQGVYRILIDARTPVIPEEGEEGQVLLQRQRDISIKTTDFPHLSTLDQLIDALEYIAYDREIEAIMESETPEEKRKRFDAFWGSLVSNRQVAGNLIKQYYSRIEEANLLFTSHKEGWKTDRGMIYVVLGAPLYVENQFDTQIWHYTYSDRDPLNTFVFRRVRTIKGEETYQNFILARRPYYERTWVRAVNRWRDGTML